MTLTIPLQINGEEIYTSKVFDVSSPSYSRIIHQASSAGIKEAFQAVSSCQSAFKSWSDTPANDRRDIFLRAADILSRRTDEVSKYEEEEVGATSNYTSGFDVPTAVSQIRDVAGRISGIVGTIPSMSDSKREAMVLKEPYGVVFSIAPWNATYILGFRAVTYALAAGNTVVLKVSEVAPKSLGVIGTVFQEAGLPNGVLNIIQTHPEDAACVTEALIKHPSVKKINFTGSTKIGKVIAKVAGENLKPVLLELGGKAPVIVLADADLKLAAQACALGAFMHSGQICMSTERILVEKSISVEFEEELKLTIKTMFPSDGDALAMATCVGVKNNHTLRTDAKTKGAEIISGEADVGEFSKNRMRPVVVKGVRKDMDLYYTESFGPTVSYFEVENEQEALRVANDTEYGLSSSVFTKDLSRGLRIAKKIESGAVHINSMSIHDEPALPHGGVKSSGWGRFGAPGIEEWVKTKTITYVK